MKSALDIFFFWFETGLSEWIFQIWSNIFKSDPVFVYVKEIIILSILGAGKTRCSELKKKWKIELAALAGPKCAEWTFGPFYHAISKIFDFIGRTTEDKFL